MKYGYSSFNPSFSAFMLNALRISFLLTDSSSWHGNISSQSFCVIFIVSLGYNLIISFILTPFLLDLLILSTNSLNLNSIASYSFDPPDGPDSKIILRSSFSSPFKTLINALRNENLIVYPFLI